MNITLAHLVVARALSGPYLSMTPITGHRSLMVDSGRFSYFFSNFLRSTAAIHTEVTRSDFRHFQDSAFFLSRAEPELVDKVFNDQQVVTGTDGENATFTSCTFYECHAQDTGGAISSTDGVAIVVEGCGFLKCTAQNNGGALFLLNETNVKDGWFGSWTAHVGAPSIVINRSCFSECYVKGESEVDDEVNKTGYVLYARAIQVFMDDFSAVDCSREGARRAAVFYGWINDMVTRGGNLTIGNSVKPVDLSPFNIQFAGYNLADQKPWVGRNVGVDHSYHCVTGFICQWVYRTHLEDIVSVCLLKNLVVIGTELLASDRPSAIFYLDFTGKDINTNKNWLKEMTLSECCAFMDETFIPSATQHFYYEENGDTEVKRTQTSCKTNVQGWGDTWIEVDTEPPVVELDLENGAHCDYEPPDPSSFESDLESEMSETEQGGGGGGDGSTDGSLGPGEIAGIIIAILVIIAIIIIIVICMRRRRDFTTESTGDNEQEKPDENSETTTTVTSVANDPLVSVNYAGTQLNQIFEDADTLTMRSFEEDEENP